MILRGTVYSRTLEMETGLTVLFPKKLTPGKKLRAAYLLHGICATGNSWIENTMLPTYAGDLGLCIIMPDLARSLCTDMLYGQKYFTYLSEELPSICQGAFSISPEKEDNFVLGGSAGGYGALRLALSNPDRFSACCAFSSAFLFFSEACDAFRDQEKAAALSVLWGRQLPTDLRAAFGDKMQPAEKDELLTLAKNAKDKPRIYLACGTEDPFFQENERFSGELGKLGFDTSFEPSSGKHDWAYFDRALRAGLDFCLQK